ncbi:hypothetical protein Tco_0276589 [Tanacetum coccineum]
MGFRLKDTMKLKKVLKPIIDLNRKNSVTHEEFIDTCANNDGDKRQPALRRLALNDVVNSLKKGRLGDQTKNLVTMYTPVSIQTLQFAATKHPGHSPTKRSIKNNSNTHVSKVGAVKFSLTMMCATIAITRLDIDHPLKLTHHPTIAPRDAKDK